MNGSFPPPRATAIAATLLAFNVAGLAGITRSS